MKGSAVGELSRENPVVVLKCRHKVAGADIGIEALGVLVEVGDDVIAVWVSVGVGVSKLVAEAVYGHELRGRIDVDPLLGEVFEQGGERFGEPAVVGVLIACGAS